MPIVKCPKCGEEYDSMYSFHSCKRYKSLNKEVGEKINIQKERNKKLFGINRKVFLIIWLFFSILTYFWLRGLSVSIIYGLVSIIYGFISTVLLAVIVYLPIIFILKFIKNEVPKIKKVGFILFIKKHFLFLFPLFILILYFLHPLYLIPVAIEDSFSETRYLKEKIDGIIAVYELEKALWEESYREATSPEKVEECLEQCKKNVSARWGSKYIYLFCSKDKCRNPRIPEPSRIYDGYDIYDIKNNSFVWLFFKNLNKNYALEELTEGLIKKFRFQNIIIMLLGLILYYGIIFGINITKRLEKQK